MPLGMSETTNSSPFFHPLTFAIAIEIVIVSVPIYLFSCNFTIIPARSFQVYILGLVRWLVSIAQISKKLQVHLFFKTNILAGALCVYIGDSRRY